MTISKHNVSEWMPIMTALAEGKVVQERMRHIDNTWIVSNTIDTDRGPSNYRIKPEPVLRPWKWSECPVRFLVRAKDGCSEMIAHRHTPGGPGVNIFAVAGAFHSSPDFAQLLDLFSYLKEDGTEQPCGVLDAGGEG